MTSICEAEPQVDSNDADASIQSQWIREAAEVCRAAAHGDLERRLLRIDVTGDLGDLLHAINHLLDMSDAFVRESTASLEYASEGKFFRRVLPEGMLGSFLRAARSINAATHAMDQKTQELRAAEQRRAALEGEFKSALEIVGNLREASKEIGEVTNVIKQIARQINLLALNASIEAARAGEAGLGFAVVAEEVKSLAGDTAGATTDIQKQVETNQAATENVLAAIERIWQTVREENTSSSK